MSKINFKGLADAALGRAEQLLAQWLPDGKREGHEWKSINPVRADRSSGSFSININTGAWGDFATDDKGGDLISLCAYLFHGGDQLAAAYDIAADLNFPMPPRKTARGDGLSEINRAKKPLNETCVETPIPDKKKRTPWVPILPVPADAAPPPVAHVVRGKPERTWCYRNAAGEVLGFVWRFVTSDGGKDILPQTWCRNEVTAKCDWRGVSFPDPRPLYGLDRFAAKPEATVLIVEGEKCADVAHEQLPELAVVSWPGGGKAVGKADWSPLAGRKVVIWPDCDAQVDKQTLAVLPEEKQPGFKTAQQIAALLQGIDCKVWTVRIPPPGAKASGWDIADAVAEGMTSEALATWMRERLTVYGAQPPASESIFTAEDADAGSDQTADEWRRFLLCTQKGELAACVANVYDILLNTPVWHGVVAFDEFAQRTVKAKSPPFFGGAIGDWEGTDDSRTTMWLTRQWRFAPSTPLVAEAVETLARANTIHPVRDWLAKLPKWDGTSRIEMWLSDYCGVEDSEYVRLVARFFLIGMVARIMKPGVKFDYCLVLEGEQGKRKSMMARILGGDWYGDTDLDLHNKDSMSALQGKWVYEFAEMGSVTRAESTKQKSFLSRQYDEFRPVYGRREIRIARQVVFIGTTNEWEWNKDPTGGRRFWPVDCAGDLNPEGLADAREQLFAEALMLYGKDERFWPSPEEQKRLFNPEQGLREQQEGLIDALHDWVWAQVADFSIADAAMTGLKLDASKLTRDLQTRIGTALRKLGCAKVEKRNGMVRYWYKPPVRNGATSTFESAVSSVAPSAMAQRGTVQPGANHAPF